MNKLKVCKERAEKGNKNNINKVAKVLRDTCNGTEIYFLGAFSLQHKGWSGMQCKY